MAIQLLNRELADRGLGLQTLHDLILDTAYPWGGYPLTARQLGMRTGQLRQVIAETRGGRVFEFVPDPAEPKVKGKLRVLGVQADDYLLGQSRPGLTIGTVSPKAVKMAFPVTATVAGVLSEVAAQEKAFTATTDDIAASASVEREAIYLVSTDGTNLFILKGTTANKGAAVPPALPAGRALVGYVRIIVAAGATNFDATTDDLDAAHLTTTFYDADGEALQGTDLSAVSTRIIAHGR